MMSGQATVSGRDSAQLVLWHEDLRLRDTPAEGEAFVGATIMAIAYQGAMSRVVVEVGCRSPNFPSCSRERRRGLDHRGENLARLATGIDALD
jgi:hypothetical protein